MVLVQTPQVSWHSGTQDGKNAPLFSLSILSLGANLQILATAGNDSTVHLWRVNPKVEMSNLTAADVAKGMATNGGSASNSPVSHILSLQKHSGCVNSIKFSPDGLTLLTAGDRGAVVLWSVPMTKRGGGNGKYWWGEVKTESDLTCKVIRTQCEDIFDANWTPCSRRFMLGSLDHKVMTFEDASPYNPSYGSSGDWKPLQSLSTHTHYVQGVSFDPLGSYAATQGSDRSVVVLQRRPPRILKPKKEPAKKAALSESTKDNTSNNAPTSSTTTQGNSSENVPSNDAENVSSNNTAEESKVQDAPPPEPKFELLKSKVMKMRAFPDPATSEPNTVPTKPARHNMYVDETMKSFFRRLAWTPDGAFLITPAGIYQETESADPKFCTYVYARHEWEKPLAILLDGEVPSIAVVPNPSFFEPPPTPPEAGSLAAAMPPTEKPHRCVFAVLTRSTIYVYDTYHKKPLFVSKNLHYAGLTDGTWSADGQSLLVSSSDGYVSLMNFEVGELGVRMVREEDKAQEGSGRVFVPPSTAPPIIPPLQKNEAAVEGRPEKRMKLGDGAEAQGKVGEGQGKGAKRRIAPTVVRSVGGTDGQSSSERAETPIPVETLSLKQQGNEGGENANPTGDGVNVLMAVKKKKKKRITPEAVE